VELSRLSLNTAEGQNISPCSATYYWLPFVMPLCHHNNNLIQKTRRLQMKKKGTKPERSDTTKERQCESRNMLKQALNECFALYINNEDMKGDSWRDTLVSDLETIFYMKVHQYKNSTKEKEKAHMLRDTVNYALMIIVKIEGITMLQPVK
jgi:hypothetical protein